MKLLIIPIFKTRIKNGMNFSSNLSRSASSPKPIILVYIISIPIQPIIHAMKEIMQLCLSPILAKITPPKRTASMPATPKMQKLTNIFPSRYFIYALSKNWLKLAYVHIMVILIMFKNIWESESSCLIVILFLSDPLMLVLRFSVLLDSF